MPSTCVSWLQAHVRTLVDKCALRYFYFFLLLPLCYSFSTGFIERGRRSRVQFVSRYGWQAVLVCKRWVKKCLQGLSMNTQEGLPHRGHLLCWCVRYVSVNVSFGVKWSHCGCVRKNLLECFLLTFVGNRARSNLSCLIHNFHDSFLFHLFFALALPAKASCYRHVRNAHMVCRVKCAHHGHERR